MLAAAFPEVGIGLLGVSLALGLTVLTMAYARSTGPALFVDGAVAGTAQDMPSSNLSIGELSVPPEDRGRAPGSSEGGR